MGSKTANGQCVRFVRDRGFGFIRDTNTGIEYFFHRSACGCNFDGLLEGDRVTFEPEMSQKGPRATNVQLAD